MNFKSWIHFLWKIPLCGLLFFIGFMPGSMLASFIGLPVPSMPAGADQATVTQYTLLGSLFMGLGLAALSRAIRVKFPLRWLLLFCFVWIVYGFNNYLEASIFSTMQDASLFSIVVYLPGMIFCSGAVALLFPPDEQKNGFPMQVRAFFTGRSASSWIWRFLAAFLSFPVAYTFFGRLISPIVLPAYMEGVNQLALPSWNQILPVLGIRSMLFLLVCLPILMTWKYSNTHLFITLGLVLFILVGGISMLSAYWYPTVLRVTHSLEIFGDEMVYSAALVLLLRKPRLRTEAEKVFVPVE